jgi:hypothetical protein
MPLLRLAATQSISPGFKLGTKWPKAVAKITKEKEPLLTLYEFTAEHWKHVHTIN